MIIITINTLAKHLARLAKYLVNYYSLVQFQKISILPPQKGLEHPGGGGFCKTKKFKEIHEAQSDFPERWEDLEKFPFVGEAWIISGTTQFDQ